VNVDRLRRAEAVLDAALTREPTEWAALLDETCSGDPELRREVEALLARVNSAERFLESPPGTAAAALLAEAEAHEPSYSARTRDGQRIGAYRVVRELGRGGMARVFLAERADGEFQQQVALKLLRPGLDSDLDRDRFRGERQILASLSHPNIARLFDGGVTEDGEPYLVMEYVEGEPLDRYCVSRNLSVAERLTLFLRVAEATTYAHRSLVVHRDLKPSNILVTADGTVKLLDFGLAKLLEPNAGFTPAMTRTGHRWMTPEYAAPEQVRGETISTLTDVYQLGVVVYELLSGHLPFSGRARSLHDLEQAILDEEPQLPSTAALRGDAPSDEARSRSRMIRGDLDAIVMKALHKEPERRYESAAALHDDIERFRAGRAVAARPDGTGYRLRKFTRRNRMAVIAAGIAAAGLIVATVFSMHQAREARRQRDAAQREARRQLAMAEVQLVLASDSRGPNGRTLSTLERIELAEQALGRRFRQEPWLVSELLTELSQRLYETGDRDAERRILARSGAIARDAHLPAQYALAECSRAYSFVYDDQFDSARTAIATANAELARPDARPDDTTVAVCLAAEGQLLVGMQKPDSSIPKFTRAVALVGRVSGVSLLGRLNDLANALRAAGRTREATDIQRRIVAALDSTGYAGTDIFPNAIAYLASGLWELGEFAQIDSIVRPYLRAEESVHGVGNTGTVLGFVYGLGKLRLGELDSADLWLNRAMRDTTQGAGGIAAWAPSAVTQLRLEQGRLVEARQAFGTLPGGTHSRRVVAALLGARLRYENGDRSGASRMLDTALRTLAADGPKPPANMALALVTAAEWHLADADPRGADSLAQLGHSAAAADSLTSQRSAYAGRAHFVRARALRSLGDTGAAREAARRAVVALTNGFGPEAARVREARALMDSLSR
jgi:eukaryotic-like serine/threonine-protein kinase